MSEHGPQSLDHCPFSSPEAQTDPQEASPEIAPRETPRPEVVLVGFGASAGGLEALRRVLPHLRPGLGAAYLVAQHLDPSHPTQLPELLSEYASLPVVLAQDDQSPQADTIYVAPQGGDLIYRQGLLRLEASPEHHSAPSPSVDRLLASLADHLGHRAVGVVLSGTGSDGVHGLRAIKTAGGLTMAQEPTTCKQGGMPKAAIAAGLVDLVLEPEAMGPELARFLTHAPSQEQPALDTESADLRTVLDLIRRGVGCDFSGYKTSTLNRRLRHRLALRRLGDLGQYLAFLERHPEELQALAKDILISVTGFFRDPEAFAALARVTPEMLRGKRPGESLRVWIPGCATGEEAYSIAMVFNRHLGPQLREHNLQIFATDMDPEAIAHARRGRYCASALDRLDPDLARRYFQPTENGFQISKALRDQIVFARHDLVQDPPFSRLDLIVCRNLLIYLGTDLQHRLIPMFHYALVPGGYLFLGKSESIGGREDLFIPVDKKLRVFQRRATMGSKPYPPRQLGIGLGQRNGPSMVTAKDEASLEDLSARALADACGHPALLLDRRLEVLYVRGEANRYLRINQGRAGLKVLDLIQPGLKPSLLTLLHKAMRENRPLSGRPVLLELDDQPVRVRVHAHPVAEVSPPGDLWLVYFQELCQSPGAPLAPETLDPSRDDRIVELERELAACQQQVQGITEDLETSSEELQSLNEELQSANEELQSSNEELETSNEELQATNEELTTVNDELQVKTSELAAVNADLENILKRMGLAMVVVDRGLCLKRFTPSAGAIFNLMGGDKGQPLTSISTHDQLPDLRGAVEKVLLDGRPVFRALTAGSRYYEMRIYPYYDLDERVNGAILTFVDNTELHKRQQEFLALAENSPDVVARYDRDSRHLYVNRMVERYHQGQPRDRFLGKTNRQMGLPEDLCAAWERMVERVFATGEEHLHEYTLQCPDGLRHFEARLTPELGPEGQVVTVLSSSRDITDRVAAEKATADQAQELAEILTSINDGFICLDADTVVTYYNQQAGRLLKRAPEQVLGRRVFEAFPEFQGSVFQREALRALRDQQPLSFETYFGVEPLCNWYDVRVYPRQGGITIYFQVTTETKKAQRDLAEREQFQRQLLDNLRAGVVVHRPDTRVLACNRAAARLWGMDEQRMIGLDASDPAWRLVDENGLALPPEAHPARLVQTSGQAVDEKVVGVRQAPDQEPIWLLVSATPVRDERGVLSQIIVSCLDLSAQRRAERDKLALERQLRQSQKMEALGTLAGGVAHDFNNILSAILGYAELIKLRAQKPADPETLLRDVEQIIKGSERARALIRQIMIFSSKGGGQFSPLAVNQVITEALELISHTVPKMIRLETFLAPDLPPVEGEAAQLEQMLVNLAANASDAMNGQGRISIETQHMRLERERFIDDLALSPGEYVVLVFGDNGRGVEPQHLSRIFDPFFTTKPSGKGTGLGLSMVHGIVRGHGGQVTCYSQPGQGTVFKIYLPAGRRPLPESPEPSAPEPAALPGGDETILVVDDEANLLELSQQMLSAQGYRVLTAPDGETALRVHDQHKGGIDLVLLDLNMPGMGGLSCRERLLERQPDLKVLIISGYSQHTLPEDLEGVDRERFMEKPFRRRLLLERVRRVLDQ